MNHNQIKDLKMVITDAMLLKLLGRVFERESRRVGGDGLMGLFGKRENVIVWKVLRGKVGKITWELGKKRDVGFN